MTDTQWRRFQVFLQEKQNQPHQDVGSVHAPDSEVALLNARDVFVRRPECASLWVVPAEAIYSWPVGDPGNPESGDQRSSGPEELLSGAQGEIEAYYVFCKPKPAGTQTLVGRVEASSPREAVIEGIKRYTSNSAPSAWGAFPARIALESDPDEASSLFAPALDKPFRMSKDFKTISIMREVRRTVDGIPPTVAGEGIGNASQGASTGETSDG